MKILGVTSPLSWNSAACAVEDGRLIALVEEERFNGIKHSPRIVPKKSIEYCLREAGWTLDDVDWITTGYEGPVRAGIKNFATNLLERNFDRMFRETGAFAEYFVNLVRLKDHLRSLSSDDRAVLRKLRFIPHHVAHASSAARCSGFEESVVITLDGIGENTAGLLGSFTDNVIHELRSVGINQSLGWFYSTITGICGFKVHSHEGKVMGLAAYGKPDPTLLDGVVELTDDGYQLLRNWTRTLEGRFPRRKSSEPLTDEHRNLAATAQHFLEEAGMRVARHLHRTTGLRNVCLAGGVALNCDMNARLMDLGCFDRIFVQPAANDTGTALGAALEVFARETGDRTPALTHAFYGPRYANDEIEDFLRESKVPYRRLTSLREVAQRLADGKIVGWFSGRMEFGPRALGGRSILAHPKLAGMKDKINREVKHREPWRPFAPTVLEGHAHEYFERYHRSPFMLLTFRTKPEKIADIQAAVHVDGTARVQEIDRASHPRYYELIDEFRTLTGIPVLLDTSFNDKEKPICLTPRDALQTFYSTGLDVLVLEDFILEK